MHTYIMVITVVCLEAYIDEKFINYIVHRCSSSSRFTLLVMRISVLYRPIRDHHLCLGRLDSVRDQCLLYMFTRSTEVIFTLQTPRCQYDFEQSRNSKSLPSTLYITFTYICIIHCTIQSVSPNNFTIYYYISNTVCISNE